MKNKRKKTNIKSKGSIYRLSVFRTNKNLFLQLINDSISQTVLSDSTISYKNGSNVDAATKLGDSFSELLKTNNINHIIFDRGRYIYTGRVKAVCDSIRKNGIRV